jgi:hypothetical protein
LAVRAFLLSLLHEDMMCSSDVESQALVIKARVVMDRLQMFMYHVIVKSSKLVPTGIYP